MDLLKEKIVGRYDQSKFNEISGDAKADITYYDCNDGVLCIDNCFGIIIYASFDSGYNRIHMIPNSKVKFINGCYVDFNIVVLITEQNEWIFINTFRGGTFNVDYHKLYDDTVAYACEEQLYTLKPNGTHLYIYESNTIKVIHDHNDKKIEVYNKQTNRMNEFIVIFENVQIHENTDSVMVLDVKTKISFYINKTTFLYCEPGDNYIQLRGRPGPVVERPIYGMRYGSIAVVYYKYINAIYYIGNTVTSQSINASQCIMSIAGIELEDDSHVIMSYYDSVKEGGGKPICIALGSYKIGIDGNIIKMASRVVSTKHEWSSENKVSMPYCMSCVKNGVLYNIFIKCIARKHAQQALHMIGYTTQNGGISMEDTKFGGNGINTFADKENSRIIMLCKPGNYYNGEVNISQQLQIVDCENLTTNNIPLDKDGIYTSYGIGGIHHKVTNVKSPDTCGLEFKPSKTKRINSDGFTQKFKKIKRQTFTELSKLMIK